MSDTVGMKVCFDADEWYPVYTVIREGTDSYGWDEQEAVEVDPVTVERWARAESDFAQAQSEMFAAMRRRK